MSVTKLSEVVLDGVLMVDAASLSALQVPSHAYLHSAQYYPAMA